MSKVHKKCKNCGRQFHGHPNRKFCSTKGRGNCKDAYHNRLSPRGIAAREDDFDEDLSWDAHKFY